MVKLVAHEALTVNHLLELGHLADSGPASLSHKSSTGLQVFQDPVRFFIGGHDIKYIAGFPFDGQVTSLKVTVEGATAYVFSQFDLGVRQFWNYINGSPQSAAVHLLSGNDSITGSGFDDGLYAYNGNDVVRGGNGDDLINGGNGNDTLFGTGGNDTVLGQGGNDTLNGGPGSDRRTGGAGNDKFVFASALGADNIDKITDFDRLHDKIVLDRSFFPGLAAGATLSAADFHNGATADAPGQHILYDAATGTLSFDADGNGPTDSIAFATVTAGLTLTAGNFLLVA